MDTTRPSLLLRLRDRRDAAAWRAFDGRYPAPRSDEAHPAVVQCPADSDVEEACDYLPRLPPGGVGAPVPDVRGTVLVGENGVLARFRHAARVAYPCVEAEKPSAGALP